MEVEEDEGQKRGKGGAKGEGKGGGTREDAEETGRRKEKKSMAMWCFIFDFGHVGGIWIRFPD